MALCFTGNYCWLGWASGCKLQALGALMRYAKKSLKRKKKIMNFTVGLGIKRKL